MLWEEAPFCVGYGVSMAEHGGLFFRICLVFESSHCLPPSGFGNRLRVGLRFSMCFVNCVFNAFSVFLAFSWQLNILALMLLLLGVGLCYLLGFGCVFVFDWAFGRFEYKFYFWDQKEKLCLSFITIFFFL